MTLNIYCDQKLMHAAVHTFSMYSLANELVTSTPFSFCFKHFYVKEVIFV